LNHLLEGVLKRTSAAASSQSVTTKKSSSKTNSKTSCSGSNSGSASAQNSAPVRVLWLSSLVAISTLPNGGIRLNPQTDGPEIISNEDPMKHYMQSKVGNVYLAHETAERLGREGILSLVSTYSLFTFLDDYYDDGGDGDVSGHDAVSNASAYLLLC
jgi:NAD(P)-dependent dehydrogenase (short-subunit alcohol dehydrogenase family)